MMTIEQTAQNDNKTVVERNAFPDIRPNEEKNMTELIEDFLEYARYELNFSPQTIIKYRDSLKSFVRDIGDKPVAHYEVQEFVKLKRLMMDRGLSAARIASVVYAMKSFFGYCSGFLKLKTVHPKQIRPPKRFKREVIYLTKTEIEAFLKSIRTDRWYDIRFRALVEVLLGSGMRIGEALSLDRRDIDWEKREAKIIGKGNKERTVFFTKRALEWLERYLERRTDTHPALFITKKPHDRLRRDDIWRFFERHRRLAKIHKKLTPHILRHTVATNLVFNGCPIVHVKEILGHERLDTTCKYYLGVDKEKAKKAHREFLDLSK